MEKQKINLKNGKILTIREANKSDAGKIITYINTIAGESDFLTFGIGEFHMTVEMEEEMIDKISKQRNALFIVAEVEGEIVGNLSFSGGARPRVEHTGEFGVSVLKEYWGMGIGKNLVECLIQWSKETSIIRKINLRVREDHIRGINLYQWLGFVVEGRKTREFYVDGKFYDAILMGLQI